MKDKDVDVYVLETSLKVITLQLNALLGECLDENGDIKTPSKKAIMKARSMLPAYAEHSFDSKR